MELLLLIIALLLAAILITLLGAWSAVGGVLTTVGHLLFVLAVYGFLIFLAVKAFVVAMEFIRRHKYLVMGYIVFCFVASIFITVVAPSLWASDVFFLWSLISLWVFILIILLPVLVVTAGAIGDVQSVFNRLKATRAK